MFVTKQAIKTQAIKTQAIKTQAIKSFPHRLSVFLATAILALNLSPLSAHADDINDMLAAGSYVEGEVIAAILTDGEQMEAESDDAYQVKELISVDSAAVQQAVEDQAAGAAGTDGEIQESIGDSTGNSALNSGYSVKVTTSLSDNINLCVISSDTMSTEELLRELADDPNVVFAEPNYILDLDSDDRSGELTFGGQEGREGQEYPESGQSTPAGLEDPGADEPAPEGQESLEDSESMQKAQEDPEDVEPAPEELYDGESQQAPENTENIGSTPEGQQDPENTENSGSTPEGQQGPEGSELMPGMQEDPEGFGPAVEASEVEVPEEEVLEDSNKRLGAQPEDGPLNDLTPLQWGNWTNDHTTRAEGAAANPSINVPGFGAIGRDGNMEKQIVVALLDTGVETEHPDLKNVMYRFTPEQQEALGCWEAGYTATGKGVHGNERDEGSIMVGHGTHTAGIIGAEWNGFGTSGVASNVKIVNVQLANEQGNESVADALVAYGFVNCFNEQAPEEERIRITSNSWGEHMTSKALDAVLRDLGERWGIVSVFSAGNDSKNNDYYEKTPSSLADNPYAIVVANSTPTDRLNESSEYGTATVDLGAPGTSILSTATEERGGYYPDATRESNLLYFGFDGEDELPIKISQVYRDGNPALYEDEAVVREDIAEPVSSAHFYGTGSIKIEIDPEYLITRDEWSPDPNVYDLQFDIDLAGTDIAGRLDGIRDLRLGFAYSAEAGKECTLGVVSSNAAFIPENAPDGQEGAEGETAQVTRPVVAFERMNNFAEDGIWGTAGYIITQDSIVGTEVDPNVISVRPEGDILSIKVRIKLPEDSTTIFIDSFGIGTQTAPYEFAMGTSMACPAVAGAAAVLASQGYEGIELASLVRSKVRIPESGAVKTRTGGIFDFTVEGSPDSGSGEDAGALAPVILDVAIDGSSVTVTGEYFGQAPGAAALARYVAGAELQPVAAKVASWTDTQVKFELEEPAEGILRVEIANAGGKHDTHMRFATKGSDVYEQDLPFDAPVGDIGVYGDGNGDWETRGPLVGLGCKLYYLPAYCGTEDTHPAFRRMCAFDLKTQEWTDLPELPEWLESVSAVLYDGRIVVEGTTMRITEGGEPSGGFREGRSEPRVYVYEPETATWTQASSEGMYLTQTIVNDGGQLKLVGGGLPNPDDPDYEYTGNPVPIMSYDLTTGAGEEICSLPECYYNPVAAAKDGTILIYSASYNSAFIRVQDGEAVKIEATPDFFLNEEGEPKNGTFGNLLNNQYLCILAPVTDGFVLVGPPMAGGASDTYILRDGSDKFEPYEKRASEDRVYSQAGCTYRGRLFIIGSAWFEPEMRLFRATAMDVPEYPGDTPCEEEPAEEVKLTYDPAGGTFDGGEFDGDTFGGGTEPVVFKAGVGDVVKILPAPTREGYTFLYWKGLDGKEYYPGNEYTVEGDQTFTAIWEKKSGDDEEEEPGGNDDKPEPDDSSSEHDKKKTRDSTDTGDSAAVGQYFAVLAAAAAALGVVVTKRRRE